jgi:iron(III) transport system ATP-binding protein
MVKLEKLSLSLSAYPVVNGVSLDVEDGELMCLLGPSGCGKTTTLRAIAGFERPEQGSVSIAGRLVSSDSVLVPPQERDIGFLFQDFALFPHLSVAANVGFGLAGQGPSKVNKRVHEMLEQTRMLDHADKYPHMLSGGQQQRVALARALAPRPRLMLLDEPFSDLDTSLRGQIRDETLRILKATRVTTIMVTHDPEEAMLMADRIALMRDGSIVQVGTPQDLYQTPIDGFTTAFFGDVNHFEGIVKHGCVHTVVGSLVADGFQDGSTLDVYLRPDAISVGNSDTTTHDTMCLRVCSVRFAGASALVQLGIENGTSPHDHLEARLPGHFEPSVGDKVEIKIDRRQTYLFEKPE